MKNESFNADKSSIWLLWLLILLLMIITGFGIGSTNPARSYPFTNQYGDIVQIYGSGIYSHDSFFKAPILIGSDFTMLFIVAPMLAYAGIRTSKHKTVENLISLFALLGVVLYYSASIAFGVTYNKLFLLYLSLFAISFFILSILFLKLYAQEITVKKLCSYQIPKGLLPFLYIAALALLIAWLPDIISSIIHHSSLALIDVYTTEITYVLDMGIISPLILLTTYLIKKHRFIGYVWTRGILKLCSIIGIMLPIQTLFQLAHGIKIPLPSLISKVLILLL